MHNIGSASPLVLLLYTYEQFARDAYGGSSTACQFWNFTADGNSTHEDRHGTNGIWPLIIGGHALYEFELDYPTFFQIMQMASVHGTTATAE